MKPLRLIVGMLALAMMAGTGSTAFSAEQASPLPGTASQGSTLLKGISPGAFLGTIPETEFLHPDVAYVLSAGAQDGNTVAVRWAIADGYYLYRDKFKFALSEATGVELESIAIPQGVIKEDPYFGRVAVLYKEAQVTLKLRRSGTGPMSTTLEVGYQGCAEAGLCYPPITKNVPLALPANVHTAKGR